MYILIIDIGEKLMQIYLVGGAVRDEILGRDPHDRDYVVVGGSIEEMLRVGYKQVGKDFPVFLHPVTKDEYALARKEVKTGDKHTDFRFEFGSEITLEEDMQRRDFTINALAKNVETNKIIDLVGGITDLKKKIIRHINSEHFGEDPLRVLRMCRFAAKFDFDVAPETMELARDMVKSGMLNHLTPERIWKEIAKALETEHFEKFILAAKECGALKVILPEVEQLWDIPERLDYHPEGNSGEHTMLVLKVGKNLSPKLKFGLLLHDIGKTTTPKEILPSHHSHDKRGLDIILNICQRLRVPNEYRNFALLGCKYHMNFRNLPNMRDINAIKFVAAISGNFKDRAKLNDFIELCRCDLLGRGKNIDDDCLQEFDGAKEKALKIFEKAKNINATQMPNFNKLPKDKNFANLYNQYLVKRVFEQ